MTRKVLLIEDNEQNRYLATFLLEKFGFSVQSAPDGLHGIDLANRDAPDIILLDIQLPVLNGYEVALALRSNRALDHVPIVAVTSFAMMGDRERAMEVGCDGYIEKPIDPATFVAEVSAFMVNKGVR